jgi:hypothetical protein
MRNACGIREPGWGAVRIWALNLAAFLTASAALVSASIGSSTNIPVG